MDESHYQQQHQPGAPPIDESYYQSYGVPSNPHEQTTPGAYQSYGVPSNPNEQTTPGAYDEQTTTGAPRHFNDDYQEDDPSNPIGYIRDPHKLIVYLIPFPKPSLANADPATMPDRFLIYTPPPPPLAGPAEGVKEGKFHKVQRKWQEEVRGAKTSTAKTASWKGVKSKAVKGISWAADHTTSANLDFLGRVADTKKADYAVGEGEDKHAEDGVDEGDTTKKTVGAEELVLIYPSTMNQGPDKIREEFVNTMLRTKTKAQREAIIASALLPVATCIDLLATPIWPFGGLDEIDAIWAYSTIRGAKTARSVTKRLSSSSDKNQLRLTFRQSERIEVMRAYLLAECEHCDPKLFRSSGGKEVAAAPTEEQVLSSIGWSPSEREKNWEDEQWEITEVKLDLKNVMHKGAKEWVKWCKAFDKDPEKAVKK